MTGHLKQAQLASGRDRPLLLPTGRPRITLLLLIVSCAQFSAEAIAQSGRQEFKGPSKGDLNLSAILDCLEPNVLDYRKSIPNLFCTEKAEIVRVAPILETSRDSLALDTGEIPPPQEVSQRRESTFRMRRLSPEGTVGVFEEFRVVNTVDGRTATKTNISEPSLAIVYGVFSNGLNIISKEGRACYSFSIRSQKKNEIQVSYVDLPGNERSPECANEEKASGRVFVDSILMDVTRIVTHVPHHQLVPDLFGSWDWSEKFAPVKLGVRGFWLPSDIHSRSASDDRVNV